jgi:4-amino-4-deoxy-L-arabinose transferase-like glycosyltransferase
MASGKKKKRRSEPLPRPLERVDPAARLEARLSPRIVKIALLVLLAAMAVLRVVYLLELNGHILQSADSQEFIETARKIASGDILLRGQSFAYSPFYYYFLGAVFALFSGSTQAVLICQFLLGIVAAFLLFVLARDLFGPLSALLSLTLYLFYALLPLYEGQVLDASFSILLPVVFLLLLFRGSVSGRSLYFLGAGVALGLFSLTRPNVMLFFPPAVVWAFFLAGREKRTFRQKLAAPLVLVLGILCSLSPVTLRNRISTGEWVLTTSHGGINFYIGNNENATGFFRPPAGMPPISGVFNLEVSRAVAERQSGRKGMTDSEVSSYWFGRGLEFIREHPRRFVELLLRKTRAFFNGYEVSLNVDVYFLRRIFTALKIAFIPLGVILPLGLLGMALTIPRWKTHLVFYLYFFSYAASVILFFVTDRYRLPVAPVLLLYAGFALRTLLSGLARPARLGALAAALAVLLLVANSSLDLHPDPAILTHSHGATLVGLGREKEAAPYFEKALQMNPRLVLSHVALARIYADRGDTAKARGHYQAALRLAPGDPALRKEADRFFAAGVAPGKTE